MREIEEEEEEEKIATEIGCNKKIDLSQSTQTCEINSLIESK